METLEKRKANSEWRLQVGHATDVIVSDSVAVFEPRHHVPDLSVYDENFCVVDARMPTFKLQGLPAYRTFLRLLQWSLRTASDRTHFDITAIHNSPVSGDLNMRWHLRLWPKDFLEEMAFSRELPRGLRSALRGSEPLTFEGYSRYEFHAWTGKVIKHTIDITNPPMHLTQLMPTLQVRGGWSFAPMGGVGAPTTYQSGSDQDWGLALQSSGGRATVAV